MVVSSSIAIIGGNVELPMPQNTYKSKPILQQLLAWMVGLRAKPESIYYVQQRTELGRTKYGQELHTFDGRNAIEDSKQEAGDLCQYLAKVKLELIGMGKPVPFLLEQAIARSITLLDDLSILEVELANAYRDYEDQ